MKCNKRLICGSPLVSVIIPFYNVEKYIAQCIKSLQRQTYSHLEIILINDKSPDNSLKICQAYARKDARIKIIDLPHNQGVCKARFHGLDQATGDYIMFVDSDDYLPLTAVQDLCNVMLNNDADIVEGNFIRIYDSWGLLKKSYTQQSLVIAQPDLFDDYFISFFGINKLGVQLCGKLYKRELFELSQVRPNDFKMGEDLIMNMQIFPFVKKYVVIDKPVYNYRYGGMTSRFNPTLYSDLKKQYYMKLKMIEKYNYQKALRSTKIEMFNVFCSNIVQMMQYKKSKAEIADFIAGEIKSGYIDEITKDVSYSKPSFAYLKNREMDKFLAGCKLVADDKKFLKGVFRLLFPLLKYV